MRSHIVHCYTIRYKLKMLKGNARSFQLISSIPQKVSLQNSYIKYWRIYMLATYIPKTKAINQIDKVARVKLCTFFLNVNIDLHNLISAGMSFHIFGPFTLIHSDFWVVLLNLILKLQFFIRTLWLWQVLIVLKYDIMLSGRSLLYTLYIKPCSWNSPCHVYLEYK